MLRMSIGAWKGLEGYQQAIINAGRTVPTAGYQLAAVQLFGGAFSFIAFRKGLGIAWSPVSVLGFCAATLIVFLLSMEIVLAFH
jgi:hypothetical protein